MSARVERLGSWRATTARRRARALVVAIACTIAAGCGSSSDLGTTQTTSQTPPATQTAPSTETSTTTTSTTTTPSDAEASGELDRIPQAPPSTGTLPALPSSVNATTVQQYLRAVFDDAQHFWAQEFSRAAAPYSPAQLTLFARAVHSGCGAQADTGPFYCPANHGVYLDLSFFEALAHHAGVGPFGLAYIVGHELGHHVQFLTGISHRVAALDQQDPAGANGRGVRVELQADCLAGVWAHSSQARGQLTEADLNDAFTTAALVGDDFQQRAAGRVVDSALWTHGSSEQRQRWLITGFRSGNPSECDTFSSNTL